MMIYLDEEDDTATAVASLAAFFSLRLAFCCCFFNRIRSILSTGFLIDAPLIASTSAATDDVSFFASGELAVLDVVDDFFDSICFVDDDGVDSSPPELIIARSTRPFF